MPRIGDEAVREKTGKGWQEWFALLDRAGASRQSHGEIALVLSEDHGVPGWWAQTITVEYERARGLREKHETPEGYQVSATRTIAAPLEEVWRAWEDDALRKRWLPGGGLSLRTATKPKSARYDWREGGRLEVYFDETGTRKTRLQVQHERLPDKATAKRVQAEWRERLTALKDLLEG
jgi:hypothetical protein